MRRLVHILAVTPLAACSSVEDGPLFFDPEHPGEGVEYDDQNPYDDVEGEGKADAPHTYDVPEDLPELERPEIIISLEGLTVHLFDRATGFSAVYPAGVGQKGESGFSFTPNGFFETGADLDDPWFYISRRYKPDYFGGFPFLRLTALNSRGQTTYGLHGPISYTCADADCPVEERDWFLRRDFVSHGCVRMNIDDIVDMFWIVRDHASTPVSIQRTVELDALGVPIDVDVDPVLWDVGDAIEYGNCGSRPDPYQNDGWDSVACE